MLAATTASSVPIATEKAGHCQDDGAGVRASRRKKAAIIGGSLGGLAAAIALRDADFEVHVFERSPMGFAKKGKGMGYVDVALWEHLRGERMMRRGVRASRQQGAFFYGDLWKFLKEGLPSGTVRLGETVRELGEDPTRRPTIGAEQFDLAVLADGGWSTLRAKYLADGNQAAPTYAGYQIWGAKLPAKLVPGFSAFGIFKSGVFDAIALPLATDDGEDGILCGCFVATPENEIVRPQTGAARHGPRKRAPVPPWFMALFRKQFGTHAGGELVRLFQAAATSGKLGAAPQYEYGAATVRKGRLVLLGDAAHMASPRTAVGAHTAIQDAVALREAFAATDDIDAALARYAKGGAKRAMGLHRLSVETAKQFLPAAGGIAAVVSPATLVAGPRRGRVAR